MVLSVVGVGLYEEHKAHASSSGSTAGVKNIGGGIRIDPGAVHLKPIPSNPNGGAVVNVALQDGDTLKPIIAKVGDIVNVSLPSGSWVLSADYGAGVAWGTGAAQDSKVVSVQLSGPTTLTINWTDPNVPARYTTQVKVSA